MLVSDIYSGADMKKLATCVVAVTGFIGTSAFAADMGVPAAPPPAPVWNWTGWYAGVNAGASFGNVNTDFNAPATIAQTVVSAKLGPASGASTFGFAGSNREYPDGFMGGGQIGYNWQYSPLIVVGLEADFQGAVERDHNTLTNSFSGVVSGTGNGLTFQSGLGGSTVLDYQTNIDWFGTVRGRIGYVWGNGQVMSYVTGGLAYGEVKINGTSTVSGIVAPTGSFTTQASFGHSQVNTGWVAGYGTEGRLGISNWTWKVEGLWMDLGHLDAAGSGVGPTVTSVTGIFTVTSGETAQVTTHSHFTDGILRGGLNYKFY
jgi:outer membrane immunogenic protein